MALPYEDLARRIAQVRLEQFGEGGIARLAATLGLPDRTWEYYEAGAVIPASIILGFIDLTGVDPYWLLTGEGNQYRGSPVRIARGSPAGSEPDDLD